MGKILKDETAVRLMRLLNGPGDQEIPQRRGGATSRTPVLVRCTSATAAGGTEVGHDQCYPAVVLDINSLVANQAEEAAVWLTILDGGTTASPITVAVPVAGNAYYGLYSGMFDPFPGSGSSDPRPRVFAIARASAITHFTSTLGTSYSVTADNAWQDSGLAVSLPSAGTYYLFGRLNVAARLDAVPSSSEAQGYVRLFNSTDSTPVTATEMQAIALSSFNSGVLTESSNTPVAAVLTVGGAKTVRVELRRNTPSGANWAAGPVLNSGGGTGLNGSHLGYMKIG